MTEQLTTVRYVPQRHPGRPRTWDRGSVIRALLRWTDETGRPPLRDDWCGQEPGRAEWAQRKWMAEHPAWPSSSCVVRHFGSWSAALEAARLPVRNLTFDNTVAERVELTRHLAARGATAAEIAAELGVSVSTVHRYLGARRCPDCDGPITSRDASRCRACTAHDPSVARSWTTEGVLGAIAEWTADHGSPPACRDWTPSPSSPGRWEAESPRWPSAAVVCDLFADRPDPWNSALAEAGASIRFRRWSDEEIRRAFSTFWTRTGRQPSRADLDGPAWHGPCAMTLRRRFGSLGAAWDALGPIPGVPS